MKMGLMTLAALTLGVSALAPSAAQADHREDARDWERREVRVGRDEWRDRDSDRHHHRHHQDINAPVSLRDVPSRVLNTALHHGNGRHVEWARYVRRDGEAYYVLHMDGARKVHINLRVATDGCLIAIERLARH